MQLHSLLTILLVFPQLNTSFLNPIYCWLARVKEERPFKCLDKLFLMGNYKYPQSFREKRAHTGGFRSSLCHDSDRQNNRIFIRTSSSLPDHAEARNQLSCKISPCFNDFIEQTDRLMGRRRWWSSASSARMVPIDAHTTSMSKTLCSTEDVYNTLTVDRYDEQLTCRVKLRPLGAKDLKLLIESLTSPQHHQRWSPIILHMQSVACKWNEWNVGGTNYYSEHLIIWTMTPRSVLK